MKKLYKNSKEYYLRKLVRTLLKKLLQYLLSMFGEKNTTAGISGVIFILSL
jgi:hypothetical protein